MARYLVFAMEGTSARARLLDDLAPETCKAVWKLLPAAGPCGHVMLGGTSCALNLDPGLVVPEENAAGLIQKGDVMFIHYNARERHGSPDAISEVIWCYGRYNMAIAPGKQQHVLGNVFAEFLPGAEAFYAMSERLFIDGPIPLKVTGEIG